MNGQGLYDWCVENGREDLIREWDTEANLPLTIDRASPWTKKRVAWRCSVCGRQWMGMIVRRTEGGQRCPTCTNRRNAGIARMNNTVPKPGRSLADRYPGVAATWHPTLNGDLTPDRVFPRARKKVWWLCPECGYEWPATIDSRSGGTGCPECAKKNRSSAPKPTRRPEREKKSRSSAPKPGRSLADLYPDLAAQWHPTLNGDLAPDHVFPRARGRAWWLCPECGYGWSVAPDTRVSGHGCPECAKKIRAPSPFMPIAVPKPGRSLADRYPDVAATWHPTRNGDLTPDQVPSKVDYVRAWWLCPECGYEWSSTIKSRVESGGCRRCAAQRRATMKNSRVQRSPSVKRHGAWSLFSRLRR